MPFQHLEVKPAERITVGAVGAPGSRVFYLQARGADGGVTLRVEKAQVQMLAVSIEQFLVELAQRFPKLPAADAEYAEADMELEEPLEPAFTAGNMGLGYDDLADRMLLVVREAIETESDSENASEASIWCTRSQLLRLGRWGIELAKRGRPLCGNCGEPIDPGGHFCIRRNGHKH